MVFVTTRTAAPAQATTSEEALVARARRMDQDAWDELYGEHHAAIYRYALIRTGHRQAAEDLAAETFLQAVRSIGRYRHRGIAFRAWLYRLAHNVTVAHLRRPANTTPTAPVEAADRPDPINDHDLAEHRHDLEAAIRQLTGDQQQVVILRFVEGLSIAETAAATGRKANAVKQLQHRATRRLRTLLQGDLR